MTNLLRRQHKPKMKTTSMSSNALFSCDRLSYGIVEREHEDDMMIRKPVTFPQHESITLFPPTAMDFDSPPLKPVHKISPKASTKKQKGIKSSLICMLDLMLDELEDTSGTDDNDDSSDDDFSISSSGSYGSLSHGDDSITYIDDEEDETDTSFDDSSSEEESDSNDDDEDDEFLFGSNSSISVSAATTAASDFNGSTATFATFSISESMSNARYNASHGKVTRTPSKRVRFSEYDEIVEIPNLSSYTKAELRAIFMDRAEARTIRRENHRLIQQMERGIVMYDLCTRGLEKHTSENNDKFRERLDMLYSAVFKIQGLTLPGGMMDVPATIACICRNLTKPCVDEARHAGLSDALEARYHIGINMPLSPRLTRQ